MKSSTNRALVAKNQSTFSAVMANSIKNLLQGYTKGIRFVAVLTVLLTMGIGQAWADTHTIGWGSATGTAGTYTNFTATSGTVTDVVSFSTAKNSASSDPAYNSGDKELRLYYNSKGNGCSITLTPATGVTITAVTITASSTSYTPTVKYNVNSGNDQTGTWSSSTMTISGISATTSLKIRNANTTTNKQLRIKTIQITYTAAASCTTPPTVSSASNSNITSTTATVSCSGGITSLGSAGCSIESYGFVYGTSSNPTISNTKVQVGTTYTTTGTAFSKGLTGLMANTTYYVRPYATNGNGTAYGTQTSFKTLELPKYTVTLVPGSGSVTNTELEEPNAGAGVTLPTPTLDCGDWEFAGWATSAVATETSSKPATLLTGTYKPASNITLYAVYQRTEETEGTPTTTTTTDKLTRSTTGINNGAGYGTWSGKNANSSAVYAGQSAGGNDAIQLRTTNSNSGIITTASGGKAKKVTVEWQSNTASGRTLDIYGKNSAYSAATDLYSTSTQGTKLGSIVNGTSTELTISGNYEYIGLRSNSNAMYLTSISIDWETTTGGGTTTTTYYHSTPDCGDPCEELGDATNLNVETNYLHTDGKTYVKFSWTPADNTKTNATSQKICFGKVDEAGTCVDDLAKNLTWTGDLKSKLEPGEYWWSIQALGDGVNYCDGDVVNGTNFTIEAPTYTVTFNAGSGTCDDESLTETSGGAGVTLPTANPPAACATDGWEFAGWWTGSVAETTTSPGELLTAGSNYKPASDCTLYAVYSYTEAGGGDSDVTFNFSEIANANSWTNGTAYTTVTISPVTINAIGGGNNGKYYTSNTSWRMYNGGSLQISTEIGKITSVSSNPSKTFTINDEGTATLSFSATTEFKSITVSYSSTTTTYNSNPTCLVPVWEGATIDKTALTVNCGERSSMDGAAKITFSKDYIFDFSNPITIVASEGFLVSTSRTPNENYQQSVSQSPLVGTDNPNTFNGKFVYVRAEAPAQSDTDLEGTITIKNNKGETLQTFDVTADVTCTQYTLTLVDRGVSTEQPTKYYAGETINEAPADPEGVCTDPIHYVFDGWATASVAAGATTYTKVTFPYTVEGNTTFYAVYRYVEDGGADSGDYVKVTDDLDDYSGDYLIVYETGSVAFDGGRNNVDDELDATSNTIEVTINGNTIASNATTDAAKFTIAKVDGGYSIQSASGYYIGWSTADKNGLNANSKYSANYYLNTISNSIISGVKGTLKYNETSGQERFRYYKSGQEAIALYRKAASYLYTTSPICGPHLAITEGKDIYVTGGNAGGTRDLVIAQTKVSYKATRLEKDKSTGNLPSIKALPSNIVFDNTKTKAVAVTFDEDSVRTLQSDGTYTITGNITIAYQPAAANVTDDIQVTLNANYNPSADVSQASFTVHARSLPSEFVIVAKSGDKWYALNGDMNTNAANPANGQVTLDNDANPTKATYAPCNTIYTFDGVPNTGDRTYVRFQGTDGAWLWASSGTNVGIQNNVLKTTPEGSNKAYNWKLYTQDNITYQFGNANSNRQLTLNGEKFGMYASGVQDIRILPYVKKCLYNYAPSNLKVTVLKGTYVTLTWDAVAGATKYQYSTNGTTWTDAGTEPTVTINGLTGDTEYTYYIRAYHEDAGVSQECIDYAEITFTTANCDDVPTDITYSADLNSITVSWTAAAPTATIKLFMDEEGTHLAGSYPGAESPYRISGGLNKNTTYYIQILADGTCASPIIPVKTEDVEVDIVEWQPQGIIVDINTDEAVGVTLENEVSYGSGIGTEATKLFFSKYYEASYNVKLVAIYNGTKNIIDLTDYTIQYGKTSWESNYITLKDFGATKGQIQPGEEIILYSYTENSADDKKILDCVHNAYPDGNWVRVTSTNNDGNGTLSFGGDKTIILCKTEYDDGAGEYYDNIIDVIGALKNDPNEGILPTNENTEEPSWGDKEGWVCETGLSIADDSQIGISTNRCLLIRNNTVTSGDNAVASNMNDFVTLCTEWKGAHVPDNDTDNGVQASCDNFAYVGTFDYSDYYTKYVPMGEGSTFDENARNADGTVTIPITDLYKYACSNIRVKLTNSSSEVLSDREYKVPIMITTTQGTDGQAFLALQENLATVEVDVNGNPTGNKTNLTLEQVREICKTCDVVVRDNATLTKVTDGTTNDHPQVHDVIVYEGASIVIPDGDNHNYTINSLALRRKGDEVASAQVQGTGKFVLPADAPVTLSMRIDANNWHWFTLPYDCDIAKVTWSDGTPAKYNTDWFLMYYDGESRAASTNPYDNHWKVYNGTTIEAGKGYIVGITGDLAHPNYTFELCFPMEQEVLTDEQKDKTVALNAWGVQSDNTPNNKGWNLVGNPYLNYYQPQTAGFAGLSLLKYTGMDPVTGDRLYDNTGNVPYLVTPIDGGWYEYRQELASDVQMMPFTAYFVQVGDPDTHENGEALDASFTPENRAPKSLQARRNASEENNDPAIVAVSLTNAKGESDKTTLLIADRFTNEYEMNADFFKWFGDYYKYYTKPVLYTIGADQGKRAFNALNEELAAQPVALGLYAAQAGNYTFSLNQRAELYAVAEVWLHDANNNTYTNLMQEDYTTSIAKTDGAGRFSLSVKMMQKLPTDIENTKQGNVWATTQNDQIIVAGLAEDMQLWIYDATGKLLHADRTTNYQHSYSVSQTGTYFIRVQNTTNTQTIKVVVE